jgi:hypothetical protein
LQNLLVVLAFTDSLQTGPTSTLTTLTTSLPPTDPGTPSPTTPTITITSPPTALPTSTNNGQSSDTSLPTSQEKDDLSKGDIAAIVLGSVVGLATIAGTWFAWSTWKKKDYPIPNIVYVVLHHFPGASHRHSVQRQSGV